MGISIGKYTNYKSIRTLHFRSRFTRPYHKGLTDVHYKNIQTPFLQRPKYVKKEKALCIETVELGCYFTGTEPQYEIIVIGTMDTELAWLLSMSHRYSSRFNIRSRLGFIRLKCAHIVEADHFNGNSALVRLEAEEARLLVKGNWVVWKLLDLNRPIEYTEIIL